MARSKSVSCACRYVLETWLAATLALPDGLADEAAHAWRPDAAPPPPPTPEKPRRKSAPETAPKPYGVLLMVDAGDPDARAFKKACADACGDEVRAHCAVGPADQHVTLAEGKATDAEAAAVRFRPDAAAASLRVALSADRAASKTRPFAVLRLFQDRWVPRTWTLCGVALALLRPSKINGSRRRRGRGQHSAETGRGDAAATSWIFRGDDDAAKILASPSRVGVAPAGRRR